MSQVGSHKLLLIPVWVHSGLEPAVDALRPPEKGIGRGAEEASVQRFTHTLTLTATTMKYRSRKIRDIPARGLGGSDWAGPGLGDLDDARPAPRSTPYRRAAARANYTVPCVSRSRREPREIAGGIAERLWSWSWSCQWQAVAGSGRGRGGRRPVRRRSRSRYPHALADRPSTPRRGPAWPRRSGVTALVAVPSWLVTVRQACTAPGV